MVEKVYLLHHVRTDKDHEDDEKIIGLYSSESAAKAAILRLRNLPGFRDHSAGFQISFYNLDEDHWTEGFIIKTIEQSAS